MIHRLVFNHIKKCAGTTLLYFLTNMFNKNHCLYMEKIDGYSDYFFPEFDLIGNAKFIHEPTCHYRNWKQEIPNISNFMMFRDPLDRLYSEWKMICTWTPDEIAREVNNRDVYLIAKTGFEAFLTSNHPVIVDIKNIFTLSLLFGNKETSNYLLSSDDVHQEVISLQISEIAIKGLDNIDVIGISENFDLSLYALCIALKVPVPDNLAEHNSRGRENARDILSPELVKVAELILKSELKIYEMANRKFQSQTNYLHHRYGEDLKNAANQLYLRQVENTPEWRLITHDEAFLGPGWHSREVNGTKISRWTGPGHTAKLDVILNKNKELFVRVRCTGFVNPKQLAEMKMKIDGVDVPVDTWVYLNRFRYFEACITPEKLSLSNVLTIEFNVGCVFPSGNAGDPRLLGLEFCEIEVGPISGFIRGGAGTPNYPEYYVFE